MGVAGLAGGAAVAARLISGPNRPWPDYRFTPFEVGAPGEDVEFAAEDGTRLAGWWLDRPDSDRVVIVCHGHRGNKSEMLGIGPGLWRAGNTVLMFDFRGNGDSADGPQSLAHYERQDLHAAVDLVTDRRPNARLAVLGFSMGAAVTILEAADDERIEAVVLDSPFADMQGVIATAIRRFRVPPFLLLRLTDLATKIRYGYRFADVQRRRDVRRGEGDVIQEGASAIRSIAIHRDPQEGPPAHRLDLEFVELQSIVDEDGSDEFRESLLVHAATPI